MKYQIYYHYNNGSTYKEEVSAPTAIKALKKAGAHNYLKNVMFQNGSEGTAEAYKINEETGYVECVVPVLNNDTFQLNEEGKLEVILSE